MSATSDAIVDVDDPAPTPGRDRREAIAVVFALSVAISSALFGRDSSVPISARQRRTQASSYQRATVASSSLAQGCRWRTGCPTDLVG